MHFVNTQKILRYKQLEKKNSDMQKIVLKKFKNFIHILITIVI